MGVVDTTCGGAGIDEIGVTALACWMPEPPCAGCGCSDTAFAAGIGASVIDRVVRSLADEATPNPTDS
jgi:hypothetical protein